MKRALRANTPSLMLGILVSILFSGVVFEFERRELAAARDSALRGQLALVQQRLNLGNAELQAAAAFMAQARPAPRSFADYIDHLPISEMRAVPWLWSEQVPIGQAAAAEQRLRGELGDAGFTLERQGTDSALVPLLASFNLDLGLMPGQNLAVLPEFSGAFQAFATGVGVRDDSTLARFNRGGRDLLFLIKRLAGDGGAGQRFVLRGSNITSIASAAQLADGQTLTLSEAAGRPPPLLLGAAPANPSAAAVQSELGHFGPFDLAVTLYDTRPLPWPRNWFLALLAGLLITAALVTVRAGQLIRKEATSLDRALSGTRRELSSARRKESVFFDHSGTANCETDVASGRFVRVNHVMCDMLGYSEEELLVRSFTDVTHPDDVALSRARLAAPAGGLQDQMQFEKRYMRKNGTMLWGMVNARLHRDEDGAPLTYSTVIIDITDRKRAEETKTLLLRELAHRVRNTVALTTSLARQTARNARSVSDYDTKLRRRLEALTVAQDLLFDSNWTSASARRIAERATAPFKPAGAGDTAITIDVPDIRLPTQQAQTLAIAIHELANNSARHGAIAHGGHVDFTGERREGPDGAVSLHLRWTETSSKRVRPPRRQGFGTAMLRTALPAQFGGTASFTWLPHGLVYDVNLPLSGLGEAERGVSPATG